MRSKLRRETEGATLTIVQLTTVLPGWKIVLSEHGVPTNALLLNITTPFGITIDVILVP